MVKLLKLLFGLVLTIILLLAVAAVVITLVVDPNDFKEDIVAQVKEKTGRDLTIDGDIKLSVFPWLGLDLGGLALSQPPNFGSAPFAAVERAQVRAKLLPLLEQRLVVDRVELQGLNLNLIRNAAGIGNWQDPRAFPTQKSAAQPGGEQKAEVRGPRSLFIDGIAVTNAQLSWDDRRTGQKLLVRDLGLETGNLVPGQPLNIKLGFAVNNETPKVSGRIHLVGTLTLSDDRRQFTVQPLELQLQEIKTGDGLVVNGVLKAGLHMDLAGQKLQISDLSLEEELKGGPLGEVQLSTRLDAQVTADLAAQHYRVEGLKLVSSAKGGEIPGDALEGVLSADVSADLAKDLLEVRGLDLKAADLHLTGRLQGRQLQGDPRFTGKLNLAPLDLRALLPKLGLAVPQTADPAVLKRLALGSDIEATAKQVALGNLQVALDDSNLNGKARILFNETLGYRFALELDAIDLDRYLPPPPQRSKNQSKDQSKAQSAPTPKQAPATVSPQPLFPVEQLRQLDIDGSFHIGRLTVHKLKLNDARITVKAKDGDIQVGQKVGGFYQGSLGGNLGLDIKEHTPRLKMVQRAQGIQAESLVKELAGEDRLSGTGNFSLNVSGSGQTLPAIKRSLGGKLNFAFINGTVRGVNLGRLLRETAAKLKGKTLPPDKEANETDFSELKGSGVIRNGVLHNQDLSAKSPLFRITGKGRIDIGRETLDYKIKPVLVASLEGQGGKDLEQLKGVPIPVHLTGPLAKPEWRIDLAEALTESQKTKAQEKLKEKIQEKLPDDIKEKIPGLDQYLDGAFDRLFN